MGGDCCKDCFQNGDDIGKISMSDNRIEPIIYAPNDEENNEQIPDLRDNLAGVTRENSLKDLNSDSSKTSDWNDSNPEHFEINIRYGHKETKFKVKKNIPSVK